MQTGGESGIKGSEAYRYAVLSQVLLFLGMVVATVIRPQFFFSFDQGGVSNYGTIPSTIVPYTVALLGCGYYMIKSAIALPAKSELLRSGKLVIHTVGIFFVLMLVSTYPYQQSLTLTYLHQIISNMTVLILLFAGVWLHKNTPVLSQKKHTFLVILISGVTLGFITVVDVVRLLFLAQVLVAVGFGGIYLRFIKVHANVAKKSSQLT